MSNYDELGISIADLVKAEMENLLSREKVTVLAAQELELGAVVGKVTAGTVPTTGTLTAVGAENGTCTSVTGGKNVKVGTYRITCIQAVTNGGVFEVTGVNGEHLGTVAIDPGAGQTGVFASDQINFTLTDGSTDFVFGSLFSIAVPAGSGKITAISPSAVDGTGIAYGFMAAACNAAASGRRTLAYTSGGTYEIEAGDTITGATSLATARVVAITLSTGTWAGGDAAGTMTLEDQSGTFQSENLNVGGNTNVATIAGNSSAVAAADKEGVAIIRNAQVVTGNLAWPSGTTAAQIATALAELALKGIIAATT